MKKFKAEWGDWGPCAHSYDPKTAEVSIDTISEDNGYDEEDIRDVKNLKVGEVWNSPLGNHRIERIK